MAFAIFAVLVGLMFLGVPVAVSMGITAVGFFVYLGETHVLTMIAQRMYAATTGFTLLAIPFFILAGNLMNTGGMTTRIFRFANALVGHVKGGLGHVNVLASLIFSGMSGSAVADAAGLGLVEIKAMDEAGYDRPFSAAVTAASSTIGPVVPPSIPFVIYGSLTNTSVGKLFLAGFIPGFMMAIAMMIAVYITAKIRNYPKGERASPREIWESFKGASLALIMPVIIIGGILSGLFTPTEAAMVACVYALFLGIVVYKEISIKDIPRILWETTVHSVRVMFIIATAGFFGWLMIHQRIPDAVINALTSMVSTPTGLLLVIIAVLLVLGCFLEGIAVLVITIPIFMPLIARYNIDFVHFGVIMILCSMIGLVTPPVGMSLYAVASISGVDIWTLSKELLPYIIGIFIVTLIMALWPGLALFLPNLVG
ncbi:MAG: TRAP transporter large permease [Synergistetes bacterium]|nr:TRAP transporter large permease [Synergistota bacterium]MCX8127587.1 TRAP transporter large permease [Synergistota bacterium]MDW8191496.1 TRAP transporter large permease [Synergistota bacterium]